MQNFQNELQGEIDSFQNGESTLEQTRNLAAHIGKQRYVAGVPILIRLLMHKDEIVRYNAVMSLGYNLRFKDGTNALVQVLNSDSDVDCRDAAAGALGGLWRNTRDRKMIEELSKVALEDQDDDVRKAAYAALVAVNGVSDQDYLEMLRQDRRPVDPARISSILAGVEESQNPHDEDAISE